MCQALNVTQRPLIGDFFRIVLNLALIENVNTYLACPMSFISRRTIHLSRSTSRAVGRPRCSEGGRDQIFSVLHGLMYVSSSIQDRVARAAHVRTHIWLVP